MFINCKCFSFAFLFCFSLFILLFVDFDSKAKEKRKISFGIIQANQHFYTASWFQWTNRVWEFYREEDASQYRHTSTSLLFFCTMVNGDWWNQRSICFFFLSLRILAKQQRLASLWVTTEARVFHWVWW